LKEPIILKNKIGIIGAGYTGLSCATYLSRKGFEVEIFESDNVTGGLAKGVKFDGHDWTIEPLYHHWFNGEKDIIELAEISNTKNLINIYSPTTSFYSEGRIRPFDKPQHILTYPGLTLVDRFRLFYSMVNLKLMKNWQVLEKFTAEEWLIKNMGKRTYDLMWKPMLIGKWGDYYNKVNMAWFWARIHVRTQKLMYPDGGFQNFTNGVVNNLKKYGVTLRLGTNVDTIFGDGDFIIVESHGVSRKYNKVVFTLGPTKFCSLVQNIPKKHKKDIKGLKSVGAVCALILLKNPILKKSYWLNVPASNTDFVNNDIPFLVFVEHTNMIPKTNYGGNNIVYCGNYIDKNNKMNELTNEQIIELYISGIKNISSSFSKDDIIDAKVYRTDYASPVFLTDHSKKVPSFNTPIENLYWASMSHIYPWDRGTNYAVSLGKEISDHIMEG